MGAKEIFTSQRLKTSIISYKTMNYAHNSQQQEIAKQKNQREQQNFGTLFAIHSPCKRSKTTNAG
jgi:hypothetical protein